MRTVQLMERAGASMLRRAGHGVDFRQMPGDAAPALAPVRAGPDLPARGAEVKSQPGGAAVRAHGLTQHGEPGLGWRQPAIQTPPAPAAIARAVHGGPARDGSAR